MASHSHTLLAAALAAAATLTAGCGAPPQVAPTPEGPLPGRTTAAPGTVSPAPSSGVGATTSPSAGRVATSCDGEPAEEQILALLRDEQLLTAETEATVAEGPLCADDWQYTVVVVPDRDPLQVITSGEPDDLVLVTAGTDVCTVDVRVRAPLGIRNAASCVG